MRWPDGVLHSAPFFAIITLISKLTFIIALISAASVLTPPTQAQVTFGMRGGLNIASVPWDNEGVFESLAVDKGSVHGVAAGAFAEFPLSARISVRPEVLYVARGYTFDLTGFGSNGQPYDQRGTVRWSAGYLEVPTLLAYQAPVASRLSVTVEAGPALGLRLHDATSCTGTTVLVQTCPQETPGDLKRIDLSLAAGFRLGAGPAAVGLRLTEGLMALEGSESGEFTGARHRTVAVTTEIKLPL